MGATSEVSKVALIIGGGSGMGAAAAQRLAADGFAIGILSSSGKGEALATQLGGVGVTGSNRNIADLQRVVDACVARWGRIDVLVNSAGHGPKGDLLTLSDEEWLLGMEVYLMNVVRTARLVTPLMQQQGGGAIINISSFSAAEPSLSFPTSSVFRSGLAAYAKLFADRYAAHNIRMNNVLPGFIDSLPEKPAIKEKIPMARYGKTTEIAALVSHLVSADAAYITGQNIRIDGGITRSL
jgi:NAD(P)-dependent dehydrogenase (short-subunit alcohol dehydrogenase family)